MDFGYDASGSNVIMNLSVDQSYNGIWICIMLVDQTFIMDFHAIGLRRTKGWSFHAIGLRRTKGWRSRFR
jgi:hypothetical protein